MSLAFKEEEWNLDETMVIFKNQLEARERSVAISGRGLSEMQETSLFTTQSLQIATTMEGSDKNSQTNVNNGNHGDKKNSVDRNSKGLVLIIAQNRRKVAVKLLRVGITSYVNFVMENTWHVDVEMLPT